VPVIIGYWLLQLWSLYEGVIEADNPCDLLDVIWPSALISASKFSVEITFSGAIVADEDFPGFFIDAVARFVIFFFLDTSNVKG
jgi:hypothetical protein